MIVWRNHNTTKSYIWNLTTTCMRDSEILELQIMYKISAISFQDLRFMPHLSKNTHVQFCLGQSPP